MAPVLLAIVGVALILLRRPLSQLLVHWQQVFLPNVDRGVRRTGETFLLLLGAFALFLALIVLVLS